MDHARMALPAGLTPTLEAGTPATAQGVPDTHAEHHEHMPAPAASPGAAVPGPDTGTPEPMPAMDHSQHPH